MKIFLSLILLFFVVVACNKDKNKVNGICYCDFANGEKQEYDLRHLSTQEQLDTCSLHDQNAGSFGGECELKQ